MVAASQVELWRVFSDGNRIHSARKHRAVKAHQYRPRCVSGRQARDAAVTTLVGRFLRRIDWLAEAKQALARGNGTVFGNKRRDFTNQVSGIGWAEYRARCHAGSDRRRGVPVGKILNMQNMNRGEAARGTALRFT
jgi:hypothetical protein